MVKEFIEGWDLTQILGEGTFAEVKLLVNRETGEACAVKEVDLRLAKNASASDVVRKEICVHKLLKHRNIVQCYGSRVDDFRQFIFLEYCSGGELFDRIEPDRGMLEFQAQGYFNQLISGVEYLHRRGVAHRDIKPENLLLTDNDILKISDFGMATVFRHQGKERLLERRCGTRPYMSPEMLMKNSYNAEPSDIWSCGIVLVAMLAGVLPWDQSTPDQKEVLSWKDQEYEKDPWSRIDNLPLSLLRKILSHLPSRRYTISQIKNHIWVKKRFKDEDGKLIIPHVISPPLKRVRPEDVFDNLVTSANKKKVSFENTAAIAGGPITDDRICASQPAQKFNNHHFAASAAAAAAANDILRQNDENKQIGNIVSKPFVNSSQSQAKDETDGKKKSVMAEEGGGIYDEKFTSFSQPVCARDLFTATQTGTQTQSSQTPHQKLVKRMTRFWISSRKTEDAMEYFKSMLEQLGYSAKYPTKGIINCETTDRRGSILRFKISIMESDGKILVDFRLSKGCGLDFKRHFAKIKKNMMPIIEKTPIIFPCLLPIQFMPGLPE